LSLDERWIRSLHVEAMRHADLHAERDPHVLFQASTIGALLEGSFEGDVSFAELAEHGDLGLGTLNHLDGEMIAIDGRFYRADVEGNVSEVPRDERTPFAVVSPFAPAIEFDLEGSLDHDRLLAEIDRRIPADTASCAVRIDGRFELVRARSVPRQDPPYRPLTEVVAEQRVFELTGVDGTMLGFASPSTPRGSRWPAGTSTSSARTVGVAGTSLTAAPRRRTSRWTRRASSMSSSPLASTSPTPGRRGAPTPRSIGSSTPVSRGARI